MKEPDVTEDRKAVVRRVYAALDAGDQDALGALIDDGFRLYLAGVVEPLDVAGMAAFGSALYAAFPDLHHTVLDQLEDGDRVATRLRMQGTHRGAFEGIAPTGSTIDVEAMNLHRVVDGRVVEQWAVLDELTLLRQIGGGGQPEQPNLELFQRMFALFSEGQLDSLGKLFTEDVTWHTSGQNPLSGEYHGREATLASFAKEFELSAGTYTSTVRDVLANDRRIVALLRASASREGRPFEGDYLIVFDVVDGQVEEAWELWMDQAMVDAFRS